MMVLSVMYGTEFLHLRSDYVLEDRCAMKLASRHVIMIMNLLMDYYP